MYYRKSYIRQNNLVILSRSPDLKGDIIISQLDISDFDSINQFTKNFKSREKQLDFLVHNAGVMACPLQ